MIVRISLRAALLVALALSAGRGQSPDRSRFVGCYAVAIGEWTPRIDGIEGVHVVPSYVRLDTAAGDHGHGRLAPNIAYPYTHGVVPYWVVRGVTLMLIWSNGFTPTTLSVRPRDSTLVGEAVAISDVIRSSPPNWPRAPVTLRRRACGP